MSTFGASLKALRKLKKVSQSDICRHTGKSRVTVSKWENGGSLPQLEDVEKLKELFAVDEYDLFCYRDANNSLSMAIDRLHRLKEHHQFAVIALIAELWEREAKP